MDERSSRAPRLAYGSLSGTLAECHAARVWLSDLADRLERADEAEAAGPLRCSADLLHAYGHAWEARLGQERAAGTLPRFLRSALARRVNERLGQVVRNARLEGQRALARGHNVC